MLEVDSEVGPEGDYAGHCWVEIDDRIVDVMHGFAGKLVTRGRGRMCPWRQRAYVTVPRLGAAVRRRWRDQMQAVAASIEARP